MFLRALCPDCSTPDGDYDPPVFWWTRRRAGYDGWRFLRQLTDFVEAFVMVVAFGVMPIRLY